MTLCRIFFQQFLLCILACIILCFAIVHRRSLFSFHGNATLVDQFDLDCDGLLEGEPEVVKTLKNWNISDKTRNIIERHIQYHLPHCALFQELLGFPGMPNSQEEADFPLAYGILVYKDILQVLMMLAEFYQPQNQYCIGISDQADATFRSVIHNLDTCFPNIHVMERPPVTWGGFEIINSTYACFDYLVKGGKPWRYYQYLSGVDLPLKTNLEMVRILKTWNGSSNMDVLPFEDYRLYGKQLKDAPLPLYKSSVSVIIPRDSADFIAFSSVTQRLLDFINGTGHSDETFWATLMGNKKRFPVPGAFEASEILSFTERYERENKDEAQIFRTKFKKLNTVKLSYYAARYHVWDISPNACKGIFTNYSCVFGVEDLAALLSQPHFIGHKLYLDFEPAALICGLKHLRRRARRRNAVDPAVYAELPLVQIHNGVALERITRPLWLLGETFR